MVARRACEVQRRVLVVILQVDLGPHLHQRVSHVLAAGRGAAVVERRTPLLVRLVDAGAACQQRAHRLRMTVLGRDVERGLALCVG